MNPEEEGTGGSEPCSIRLSIRALGKAIDNAEAVAYLRVGVGRLRGTS